jgi:hypothetical protein
MSKNLEALFSVYKTPCHQGTCWIITEQQKSVTKSFKESLQSDPCEQPSSLISNLNIITSFMQHFIHVCIMPGWFIIFILMILTPFQEVLKQVSVMISLFISLRAKNFPQYSHFLESKHSFFYAQHTTTKFIIIQHTKEREVCLVRRSILGK